MTALVTIGVPVYNAMESLEDCLDGLMAQTYPHLRILISDNASTDGTAELAARYAARDSRVELTVQPENLGPNANFQSLLAAGQDSPYFMWRAHDDLSTPDYVATLVDLLETHPDKDLAFGTYTRQLVEGGQIRRQISPTYPHPDPRTDPFGEVLHNLRHFQSSWIYGLWRPDALTRAIDPLWEDYLIPWAMDLLVLMTPIMQNRVILTDQTGFTRRILRSARRAEGDNRAPADMGLMRGEFVRAGRNRMNALSSELTTSDLLALDSVLNILAATWASGREKRYRMRMDGLMNFVAKFGDEQTQAFPRKED